MQSGDDELAKQLGGKFQFQEHMIELRSIHQS